MFIFLRKEYIKIKLLLSREILPLKLATLLLSKLKCIGQIWLFIINETTFLPGICASQLHTLWAARQSYYHYYSTFGLSFCHWQTYSKLLLEKFQNAWKVFQQFFFASLSVLLEVYVGLCFVYELACYVRLGRQFWMVSMSKSNWSKPVNECNAIYKLQ